MLEKLASIGKGGPVDVAITYNSEQGHLEDELCVVGIIENVTICLPRLQHEIDENDNTLMGQDSTFRANS